MPPGNSPQQKQKHVERVRSGGLRSTKAAVRRYVKQPSTKTGEAAIKAHHEAVSAHTLAVGDTNPELYDSSLGDVFGKFGEEIDSLWTKGKPSALTLARV